MITLTIVTASSMDCIAPSMDSFSNAFAVSSRRSLPMMPPNTAPVAREVLAFRSSLTSSLRPRMSDATDMESTAQPEQKLSVLTGITPSISSTGFIITPPPAPTMEPMVDASSGMSKNSRNILPPQIYYSVAKGGIEQILRCPIPIPL